MRRHTDWRHSRNRRGATLVLVAVMLLVMGSMAALAIDFARVYAGTSELSTSADAAALVGADELRRNPLASPVAMTRAFAVNNSAFGSPMIPAVADIEVGQYDPATLAFTAGPLNVANAVKVTSRRTTGTSFAGLVGLPQITPRRSAVAWIATQFQQTCIMPWGIDLTHFATVLGQPLTSPAGVDVIRSQNAAGTAGQKAITIVAGPDVNVARPGTAPATAFSALGNSIVRYQDGVEQQVGVNGPGPSAPACDQSVTYRVNSGQSVFPGQGLGAVPQTTAASVNQYVCNPRVGITDATCYDPTSPLTDGVTVYVAAVTVTGPNNAQIDALVGFRLMCVFRGGSGASDWSEPTETCPWLNGTSYPTSNYLRGTVVGYPVITQAKLGPGNTVGSVFGPSQKLMLVQ